MNLTDQEILELTELCNGLVDGTLTDGQRSRLAERVGASEDARRFYVRFLGLSASLHQYAGEMQVEAADVEVAVVRPWWRRRFSWVAGSLAVAATLLIALTSGLVNRPDPDAMDVAGDESVAQVTGVKDCQAKGAAAAWRPGDDLRRGQRIELASGLLELTFDCGAQVTLEGPATFEANSEWEATLVRGSLHAHVPPEAIGFRLSGPGVEVLDLGTEFSLVAASEGNTDVYVLQGQVEVTPRDADGRGQPAVLLHAEQGRRFGPAGHAAIAGAKPKVAWSAKRAKLERFSRPVGYAQWSFDEPVGRLLRAATARMSPTSCDAQLESAAPETLSTLRAPGRWKGALRLDGQAYAAAPVPESAANRARTVACWVRLDSAAAPAETAAMVAWQMKMAHKPEGWPVAIGCNARPGEGTFGALRAECARMCVVGNTALRDGRWHHVAAVFLPPQRGRSRLHVKLYVDGKLERGTVTHLKKRHREMVADSRGDRLWIGRRLLDQTPRGSHFRGELDELLIADRALAPQEIKHLLTANTPVLQEFGR